MKFSIAYLRFLMLFVSFIPVAGAGLVDDLFREIKQGNADAVYALLAKGADPNATDSHGNSALMLAGREGGSAIVKVLLRYGAKVYTSNQQGETALMMAALKGDMTSVNALLAKGAAPTESKTGWNPMLYAAFGGHPEIVEKMLGLGVDIDSRTDIGITALMLAAREGHADVVKLLLAKGANPDLETETGASARKWALANGNTDIAALLQKYSKAPRSK